MNKKLLRNVVVAVLIISGFYARFADWFVEEAEKQTQYKVFEDGSVEEIEVDKESSEAGEVAGESEESLVDSFAQVVALENFDAGYRLMYPAGFKANYQYGKVEIVPPFGKGLVIVYIKNGGFEVKVITEGVGKKEAKVLVEAGKLVENSFEFTNSPGYDMQAAEERFR